MGSDFWGCDPRPKFEPSGGFRQRVTAREALLIVPKVPFNTSPWYQTTLVTFPTLSPVEGCLGKTCNTRVKDCPNYDRSSTSPGTERESRTEVSIQVIINDCKPDSTIVEISESTILLFNNSYRG